MYQGGYAEDPAKYNTSEDPKVDNILYIEDPTTGCWNWQGKVDEYGYARRGNDLVHRKMWEALNGPIPCGMSLLHSCDNKKCIRPIHMFVGTHQNNMDDMANKGRRVTEQQKLTKFDVNKIREEHSAGKLIKVLAVEYSISYRHMRRIIKGLRWRDDISTPRKY